MHCCQCFQIESTHKDSQFFQALHGCVGHQNAWFMTQSVSRILWSSCLKQCSETQTNKQKRITGQYQAVYQAMYPVLRSTACDRWTELLFTKNPPLLEDDCAATATVTPHNALRSTTALTEVTSKSLQDMPKEMSQQPSWFLQALPDRGLPCTDDP